MSKKLGEAMLFFMNMQNEIQFLGKTKLAKLLYFADFDFFSENHTSITGTRYIKKEHGPFPESSSFYDALESLEKEGAIEVKIVTSGNYDRDEFTPCREADRSCFSDAEIATLERTGKRFSNLNAKQIKAYSHGTPAYVLTEDNEIIDYKLSYY